MNEFDTQLQQPHPERRPAVALAVAPGVAVVGEHAQRQAMHLENLGEGRLHVLARLGSERPEAGCIARVIVNHREGMQA